MLGGTNKSCGGRISYKKLMNLYSKKTYDFIDDFMKGGGGYQQEFLAKMLYTV